MKNVIFFLPWFVCITAFAQKKIRCLPLNSKFDNFKKGYLNVGIGIGGFRNIINDKNYFGGNLVGEIDYFATGRINLGVRTKPSLITYIDKSNSVIVENNAFIRYYPVRLYCHNLAVFGEGVILGDNAKYTLAKQPLDKKPIYIGGSIGMILLTKANIKFQAVADFFINRANRAGISAIWNIKSTPFSNQK